MGFREVSVVEVREVLRAWLEGHGQRRVAERAGVDRKTARRYVVAAQAAGLTDVSNFTDSTAVPPTGGRPWPGCCEPGTRAPTHDRSHHRRGVDRAAAAARPRPPRPGWGRRSCWRIRTRPARHTRSPRGAERGVGLSFGFPSMHGHSGSSPLCPSSAGTRRSRLTQATSRGSAPGWPGPTQ